MSSDGSEVVRYVVQHTHKPTEQKPKQKPKPKQDPRVARATRLREETELLEQKIQQANDILVMHPLVDAIEEAQFDAEWLERGIDQKEGAAAKRRLEAAELECQAATCQEEAQKLWKEAGVLKERSRVLIWKANDLEKGSRRELSISRQDGPHSVLRQLQKTYNTQTRRIRKQNRESQKKLEKLKQKLGALLEEIAPILEVDAKED